MYVIINELDYFKVKTDFWVNPFPGKISWIHADVPSPLARQLVPAALCQNRKTPTDIYSYLYSVL
jgi:hypothetical protein